MENKLTFIETLTVGQFKAQQNVDTIQVKQNPHTGKLFFTYGSAVGAVAKAGVPAHPVISKVSADGSTFYLLHEESAGGAPVVATF